MIRSVVPIYRHFADRFDEIRNLQPTVSGFEFSDAAGCSSVRNFTTPGGAANAYVGSRRTAAMTAIRYAADYNGASGDEMIQAAINDSAASRAVVVMAAVRRLPI